MKSARDALWSFASQGCDDANKALPIIERMLREMINKRAKRKAPNATITGHQPEKANHE
jgi:hypothetical protein